MSSSFLRGQLLSATLWKVFNRCTCEVIQLAQVWWHIEIRKVYVLRVKFLDPVHNVDNLLKHKHPFLSNARICIVLLVQLQAALFEDQDGKVSNLAVHDVYSVHLVRKVVLVDLLIHRPRYFFSVSLDLHEAKELFMRYFVWSLLLRDLNYLSLGQQDFGLLFRHFLLLFLDWLHI